VLGRGTRTDFIQKCAEDLNFFAKACRFEPTFQQQWLIDRVMEVRLGKIRGRIAVKSGQGPGKTTVSGLVGLWLSMSDPYSKLIVTAPTFRQCKDVWLAECKQTLRRADPIIRNLYNITGTGYGVLGHKQDEWGCLLVTATTPQAAQGQHRKDMHLIVEEASGVPREMIEQYKGTLSNPGAIFIQIGNPNSRDCDFYDCFSTQADRWVSATWNAEETPASAWFDPQRNKEIEEEFGRDSDVYRVRVMGEFPATDPNCVMSPEDVLDCMSGKYLTSAMAATTRNNKQIGMDFARFGGDENTIFFRYGLAIIDKWWGARVDPNDAIDRAFRMQHTAGWRDMDCRYVADAGGIGQGVMGNFVRAGKRLYEFHNNSKATRNGFANKITQAWFYVGKLVKEKKCHLPKDNLLLRQLTTRQYYTDSKGRLILESKDDYMKRGHESPDRADGLVLAYFEDLNADTWISTPATRGENRAKPRGVIR